jgi:hypothetical protein
MELVPLVLEMPQPAPEPEPIKLSRLAMPEESWPLPLTLPRLLVKTEKTDGALSKTLLEFVPNAPPDLMFPREDVKLPLQLLQDAKLDLMEMVPLI